MNPGEMLRVKKFPRGMGISYLYPFFFSTEGGNREVTPSLRILKRATLGVRVTVCNDEVYPLSPHPSCATCPAPQKECGLGGSWRDSMWLFIPWVTRVTKGSAKEPKRCRGVQPRRNGSKEPRMTTDTTINTR